MTEPSAVSVYAPKPHIQERARVSSLQQYTDLYRQSVEDPERFWDRMAECVTFFHPYQRVLEADFANGEFAWFTGGKLNASWNCVDRHAATRGDEAAILWVGDAPGTYRRITWAELLRDVGRMANLLRAHGGAYAAYCAKVGRFVPGLGVAVRSPSTR